MKNIKLTPISKTLYKLWHKDYKKGITVIPRSKKYIKKAQVLTELLNLKINEAQNCMKHQFGYSLFEHYRLYRRGKNRCLNCGVKL